MPDDGRKKPPSLFIREYFKSLKPWETEEIINRYFNRPLAYLVARFFKRIGATPNFVTMISMISGVSSGFFFARGDYRSDLIAAVLLELMIVFDCADGQLARVLGKSSQLGKTLDGLADMATHLSIFYGTAYSLSAKTGVLYPYILAAVAQLSMYLHIMLYDHFKSVFITVTYPDYEDKLENLEKLRDRADKAGDKGALSRLLPKMYYMFYKLETAIVSIGYLPPVGNFFDLVPDPDSISPYSRERYYSEMRPAVRLWSFLGDTIHLTFFILFALLGKTYLLFPAIILLFNFYMIFVLVYQRNKFGQLQQSGQAFEQAGLD